MKPAEAAGIRAWKGAEVADTVCLGTWCKAVKRGEERGPRDFMATIDRNARVSWSVVDWWDEWASSSSSLCRYGELQLLHVTLYLVRVISRNQAQNHVTFLATPCPRDDSQRLHQKLEARKSWSSAHVPPGLVTPCIIGQQNIPVQEGMLTGLTGASQRGVNRHHRPQITHVCLSPRPP